MRWPAVAICIAAACLVWLPVQIQSTLYGTQMEDPVPAGEITSGFSISQVVVPRPTHVPAAEGANRHCFGIRFATYMRRNSGRLGVEWQQGLQQRKWKVKAGSLADNTFRYFCPGMGFSARKPFLIRVSGISGRPGKSATLWLTADTSLGALERKSGMALALDVVEDRRVGLAETLRVNRGAFLFGWLCTLLVAGIALTRR